MVKNYPALIITYARPDGVSRLLDICHSVGLRKVYIAIDGPSNFAVLQKQLEILKVIEGFQERGSLEIHVWQRSQNLGAAVSVISAVDWFFLNEKSGFILEDDLVPSSDFFRFASDGLTKFELNEEVWMISGSRLVPTAKDQRESEWSCYPMIWGWATWGVRWQIMRRTFTQTDRSRIRYFFSAKYNFWFIGSKRAKLGLVDAWDIPLAFSQWSQSKFSIIPPVNLVTNVGFDAEATHTSGDVFPLNHPSQSLPADYFLTELPSLVSPNSLDSALERTLFRISLRHRALRLYAGLANRVWHRSRKLGDLDVRLSRVVLPD